MPSATDTNNSFLANNQGTLTETVSPFPDFFATLLGSVDAEPVEVGEPPERKVRNEITRSRNQGGRKTGRRRGQFARNERRRELNFARKHQGRLNRLIDNIPGMQEGNSLLEKLNEYATRDLNADHSLTAGENRTAQQNAREAFSARGLANSDPAAVAEVLNRDQFGDQRYKERFARAQGLIGQNFAKSAAYDPLARLGLGTGRDGLAGYDMGMQLAQSIQNQDAAAHLGVTQQQASIDSAASLQNAQLGTQANLQSNQFGYDDYNTRLNHLYGSQIGQLNVEAAQQAAQSSLGGSAIGAIGSIFGGPLGGALGGALGGGAGAAAGGGGGFLSGLF